LTITRQHTQENLSRAYLYALAGKSGVNIAFNRVHDYGIDGTLIPVVVRGKRRIESGFPVDFQLKSSVNWVREETHVAYDLEVKT
jgi:hypothetical protein